MLDDHALFTVTIRDQLVPEVAFAALVPRSTTATGREVDVLGGVQDSGRHHSGWERPHPRPLRRAVASDPIARGAIGSLATTLASPATSTLPRWSARSLDRRSDPTMRRKEALFHLARTERAQALEAGRTPALVMSPSMAADLRTWWFSSMTEVVEARQPAE